MSSRKKTKIVATLGPASNKEDVMEQMILSGVDVFRINFSHAEHREVEKRIKIIRDLGEKLGCNTSILADLQGPKLRIGEVEEKTVVTPGDQILFLNGEPFVGNNEKVFMNYDNFSKDVKPGERILLDDGKLIFEVISTDKRDKVETKVIQGGKLKSKKGVNLPNTKISLPALTQKDVIDAMELHWEELKHNSKREQLSFNYIAWKTKLNFNYIQGDSRNNKYFVNVGAHKGKK